MKLIIPAAALIFSSAVMAQAAEPVTAPIPKSSVEVFHIVPGQHEAFLNMLARIEAACLSVGLEPSQLYIHDSGASWDFILIKRENQDPQKIVALFEILHKEGFRSGPDYFFESRKMFTSHEDTSALGLTTATDYLATRKANRSDH